MITSRWLAFAVVLFTSSAFAQPAEDDAGATEPGDAGVTAEDAGQREVPDGSTVAEDAGEPAVDAGNPMPAPGLLSFADEILVQGERPTAPPPPARPPSSETLTRQELARGAGIGLEDSFNLLPGVRLESRSVSGGMRVTIRGYGNDSNATGMGYKAYLNGIPITDGEGTTILDDIDFSTLGKVEVIKGPGSSLYGSGLAGVLQMYTLQPAPHTARLVQELVSGSNGLLRTNTRAEYGTDDASVIANYGHQHSDGYRVHSASDKDYALLSATLRASSKQTVSVYAGFNRSFEQLAGQLNDADYVNRQATADPAFVANNASVSVSSARFGASHQLEFSRQFANVVSAFVSGYQIGQPLDASRNDRLAFNFGGREELRMRFDVLGQTLTGVLGTEVQETHSFEKSYGLTGGVLAGVQGDTQVRALQSTTFTQWDLTLPYALTVTAGAGVTLIHYDLMDQLANSDNPTHADQSGYKKFDGVVTPRLAVSKVLFDHLSGYAQVSEGFSHPTLEDVIIGATGKVNTGVRPERATLVEVGSKGTWEGLWYEAALFDMRIRDRITPRAVVGPGGAVLYNMAVNAGSQNNVGLELAAKYELIKDPSSPLSTLRPFFSYTFSSFRYDNFKSDNNNNAQTVDYAGNQVVGTPPHVINLGVDVALKAGLYLNSSWRHVSPMPLTFDNTQSSRSYSLLNAKVGFRDEFGPFQLDVFVGANNLTGSTYYTMVFLNADYSGPAPNVYLPGSFGPVFYGGINLSYKL